MTEQTKTYSGGSDASMGMAVPESKPIDIAKSIAMKVDDWFPIEKAFDESKIESIRDEIGAYKLQLEEMGTDAAIIGKLNDALDDLNGTAAKELARFPIDQAVSMLLYPVGIDHAAVKLPVVEEDINESAPARYLPEDVVALPSIMKIGIIKSYVKVGDDFVYDIELINDDRLPVGRAMAEESTLIPRSKSAVKHSAMKLASTMQQYVDKVQQLVDQIGSEQPLDLVNIDQTVALASDLLTDKSLEKKYFRAMQTSQYALGAAKQILQTTKNEEQFNEAVLKAYAYAAKVLEDLPNGGQQTFASVGIKSIKTLVEMMRTHEPDANAIGSVIIELSSFTKESSVKSVPVLVMAISQLKKARKSAALEKTQQSLVEMSVAVKALKSITGS